MQKTFDGCESRRVKKTASFRIQHPNQKIQEKACDCLSETLIPWCQDMLKDLKATLVRNIAMPNRQRGSHSGVKKHRLGQRKH